MGTIALKSSGQASRFCGATGVLFSDPDSYADSYAGSRSNEAVVFPLFCRGVKRDAGCLFHEL
jgi:hypothetical protein